MTESEFAEILKRNPEVSVAGGFANQAPAPATTQKAADSPLEARFLLLWEFCDGQALEREYRFEPSRKWRADFAHLPSKTIIEIEGGLYGNGRHQRIGGYQADCEKYNWATMLEWRVIRLTSAMITYDCVESIIEWMGAQNDSI